MGSLGTLSIDAAPFAIGGQPGSAPTQSADGMMASGQIDLVHLNLGLSGTLLGMPVPTTLSDLANLYVGHLEASADLNAPILCTAIPAPPTTTPVASQAAAGATPGELPRTGGQGGLWQPGLGVGLLALAGGAFALLRISRRRTADS